MRFPPCSWSSFSCCWFSCWRRAFFQWRSVHAKRRWISSISVLLNWRNCCRWKPHKGNNCASSLAGWVMICAERQQRGMRPCNPWRCCAKSAIGWPANATGCAGNATGWARGFRIWNWQRAVPQTAPARWNGKWPKRWGALSAQAAMPRGCNGICAAVRRNWLRPKRRWRH